MYDENDGHTDTLFLDGCINNFYYYLMLPYKNTIVVFLQVY